MDNMLRSRLPSRAVQAAGMVSFSQLYYVTSFIHDATREDKTARARPN